MCHDVVQLDKIGIYLEDRIEAAKARRVFRVALWRNNVSTASPIHPMTLMPGLPDNIR
jgi:hypothetical protein